MILMPIQSNPIPSTLKFMFKFKFKKHYGAKSSSDGLSSSQLSKNPLKLSIGKETGWLVRPGWFVHGGRVKSGRFEDRIFARHISFSKCFATAHFSVGEVVIHLCHHFQRHFPHSFLFVCSITYVDCMSCLDLHQATYPPTCT